MIEEQKLTELLSFVCEQLFELQVQRTALQMKVDAFLAVCEKNEPQGYEAYVRDLQQTMPLTDAVVLQIRQQFEPLIQRLKKGKF